MIQISPAKISKASDVERAARRSPSGFTLVELLAVLMIMGLLTTAVSVRWKSVVQAQQIQSAAKRIQAFDEMVRSRSPLSESVEVRFDIDNEVMSVLVDGQELPHRLRVPLISLELSEDRFDSGVVQIPYFPDGSSLSYIIHVGFDRTSHSIVVLGGTGQFQIVNDDFDGKEWFASLNSP